VNSIVGGWNLVEKFLVGLLALASVASAFYGVIMRYLFQMTPDWIEEIIIYMIIWSVFLVASTLVEERGHVAATLLVERFPLKMRRFLAIFNAILALAFCLLIVIFGFHIVNDAFLKDARSVTSLRFPLWISYLSVVTGCALMSIRYGIRIYRLLFFFEISQILEEHERIMQEENL
jgi:C4-dicarboxylate transporter DctQ subunit